MKLFAGTDFNPKKLPFKWVALVFGLLCMAGSVFSFTQIQYGGLVWVIAIMFGVIGGYLLVSFIMKMLE